MIASANLPPLLVIGGPTATGKTGLAIRLAEALGEAGTLAEIVSADSRQVYRGLDIGTAKVTRAERDRIRHHGLDLVDPDDPFSVADFAAHAARALAGIADRGAMALLVGGTGLYLRAVARGVSFGELPSAPEIRTEVEALLADQGLAVAVAELRDRAPRLAGSLDLHNPRRVGRALEIARIAGDVDRPVPKGYVGPAAWLGLSVEPTVHRAWIEGRARAQFEAGLEGEAAALRARFDPRLRAFSAIGYREAWAVLDGQLTREAAIEADALRNVAFARRQRAWFRTEPDIEWIVAGERIDPLLAALAAAGRLLATQRRGGT